MRPSRRRRAPAVGQGARRPEAANTSQPSFFDRVERISKVGSVTLLFLSILLLGKIVFDAVYDDAITVQPFLVSPVLQQRGYSGDAVARLLVDEMGKIRVVATAEIAQGKITPAVPLDLPSIRLPETEIPLTFVVKYLRDVLSRPEVSVAGDVLSDSNRLLVDVRISSASTERVIVPTTSPDSAIRTAAMVAVRLADPATWTGYLFARGDTAQATQMALFCIRHGRHKDAVIALNLLGRLYAKRHLFAAAMRTYQRAIRLDARDLNAYLNWAEALNAEGRYAEADQQFERAIRISDEAWPYTEWGEALEARGDARSAVKKFSRAVAIDSDYADAYRAWATAMYVQQNYDEGDRLFSEAISREEIIEGKALVENSWGLALHFAGRHKDALLHLDRAIAIDSEIVWFVLNRALVMADAYPSESTVVAIGRAHRILQSFGEHRIADVVVTSPDGRPISVSAKAVLAVLEAKALAPTDSVRSDSLFDAAAIEDSYSEWVEQWHASTLLKTHRLDLAAAKLTKALEYFPSSPTLHSTLAEVLAAKGDTSGALREFGAALAVDSSLVVAHLERGELLEGRDPNGALKAYRTAVRADSMSADVRFHLGVALMNGNNLDGAIAELRRAIRLDSTLGRGFATLAYALQRKGGADTEVVRLYANAIRLDPVPFDYRQQSEAEKDLGREASAIETLRRGARRYPNDGGLQYKLGQRLFFRDPEEAAGHFAAAINLLPVNDSDTRSLAYDAWAALAHDLATAIVRERRAVALNPTNAGLRTHLEGLLNRR